MPSFSELSPSDQAYVALTAAFYAAPLRDGDVFLMARGPHYSAEASVIVSTLRALRAL